MEIADIRRELGLENLGTEDIDKIKLQLQTLNDTIQGGLRSANLKEYRNTYIINAQDSLDATYPMYVHFNIISEMTKIVSIKLSFWFLNFRAYSTGAKSGGGSNPTSSDGGSANPTTSDGGSANPTTSEGGGQTSSYVGTPSGGGSTTGYKGSASGGGATSGTESETIYVINALQISAFANVNNVGSEGLSGKLIQGNPYGDYAAARYHTHSTPNHTHPNHYHTTPNHTHPTHAHTVSDHNHTVTIANHTHTVTIANHTHTVTIADHTHEITYGIHEEENSPTIMPSISRDNGLTYSLPIGSYTKDQENLDITRFIDKAGSKMIKFTSTTRARLSVQIEIKLDIKAR